MLCASLTNCSVAGCVVVGICLTNHLALFMDKNSLCHSEIDLIYQQSTSVSDKGTFPSISLGLLPL